MGVLKITTIIVVIFLCLKAEAASPFQKCGMFFRSLFVSEEKPVLAVPKSDRIYPKSKTQLIREGELQRAIWLSNDPELVSKVENFLKTANIVKEEKIARGATQSKKVTLEGVIDGNKISINTIQKTMGHQSEVAFYELEKKFGLSISPVTVEREVGLNQKTSHQLFVDNAIAAEDLNRLKRGDHELMTLDMLDYLTGNYDRPGNYLITLDQARIVSIDGGFAFTKVRPGYLKPHSLAGKLDENSISFFNKLKTMPDQEIVQTLEPYLDQAAISDVLLRRKNLVEFMQKKYGL